MAQDSGESAEWRYGVDEVGEDAEPNAESIAPESIDPENALFVVLGVVGTVALFLTVLL